MNKMCPPCIIYQTRLTLAMKLGISFIHHFICHTVFLKFEALLLILFKLVAIAQNEK